MRRALQRAGAMSTGVLAVAAMTLPFAPPASAFAETENETAVVRDSSEAWYQTLPVTTCGSPVGCPPVAPPTSYPAETLHISANSGSETARTYVKPDLSSLPFDAELTAARMRLPFADAASGSSTPEAAKLRACLVKEPFTDGTEASVEEPPDIDCKIASAKAVLAPTKDAFVIDLAAFVKAWGVGTPNQGVVLIPDEGDTGTWHIALNGKDRPDTDAAKKVTTTLDYEIEVDDDDSFFEEEPVIDGPITTPEDTAVPPIPDTFTPPAPTTTVPPATTAPNGPATPATQPVAYRQVSWVSYRGVVYLPLLLLVGGVVLARTLTRPVPPLTTRTTS